MNTDNYLSEVNRILRERFRPDPDGFMAVAPLGYAVKRAIGHNQTAFGFEKFKDVLRELESRGLLKTGIKLEKRPCYPDAREGDGGGGARSFPHDTISSAPQPSLVRIRRHRAFRPPFP